jgi:CheY-like chemotaxis protein
VALGGVVLVAVTGSVLHKDVANATEEGFDRHMAKPVDAESLERALATAEPGGPRNAGS